jgi:Transglycosylase SLT domain
MPTGDGRMDMATLDGRRNLCRNVCRSASVFGLDVGSGLLVICHNSLASLGLAAIVVVAFAVGNHDLRHQVEGPALDWLQARHDARAATTDELRTVGSQPSPIARATAIDPASLPPQQAAVAQWISRRYKVAPEPIGRLVQEAWALGNRVGLDPTLILAVVAVESRFNPFAQSNVGAQGLMQVVTRVHDDKYEAFGGTHAAFDPVSNLRVGVQVLRECISRAGNLSAGLRHCAGDANLRDGGGYSARVLLEQRNLRNVADFRPGVARLALLDK